MSSEEYPLVPEEGPEISRKLDSAYASTEAYEGISLDTDIFLAIYDRSEQQKSINGDEWMAVDPEITVPLNERC